MWKNDQNLTQMDIAWLNLLHLIVISALFSPVFTENVVIFFIWSLGALILTFKNIVLKIPIVLITEVPDAPNILCPSWVPRSPHPNTALLRHSS